MTIKIEATSLLRPRRYLTPVLVLLFAACSDASSTGPTPLDPTDPNTVATELTLQPGPGPTTLQPHQAFQLAATPVDANHKPVSGYTIEWSSSDTTVATVSDSGLVMALESGTTTVTATGRGHGSDNSQGRKLGLLKQSVEITVSDTLVASVDVSPDPASVQEGGEVQLQALIQDSLGETLQNRPVTWASTAPAVAQVDGSGLVTGVATGTATVIATSADVADTATVMVSGSVTLPPAVGAADPGQLPQATGQTPSGTFSYGRGLKAGQSYVDPTTGVRVLKLTDANTPATNERVNVHIAQASSISLPWGANGEMRTLSVMARTLASNGSYYAQVYLVDVNTETLGISNWRNVSSAWGGADAQGSIAFSPNPSTPRIVYVGSSSQIRKWNTQSDAFVSDGKFPKTIPDLSRGSVLSVSADEKVFVVTQYNRQWFKYWHVDTGFICLGGTGGQGGLSPDGLWGWGAVDDQFSNMAYKVRTSDCSTSQPFTFRVSHPAGSLPSYLFASDPTTSGGPQTHYWDLATDQVVDLGGHGTIVGGSHHMAGNWVVGQPSPPWGMLSTFEYTGVFDHAIGFVRLNGANPDPRLLVHTGAYPIDDSDFYAQPHAQSSPDGRIVIWSSNQNQSGHIDVFLTLVPGAK